MNNFWRDLFIETIKSPSVAAQRILSSDVPRNLVYMALLVGCALNTIRIGVLFQIVPPPAEYPALVVSPIGYFVISTGMMVLFVHLLTWAGRAMGGQGSLDDLLKLVVWLQLVLVVLQIVGLLLLLAIPALGSIFVMFLLGLSAWLALNFVKDGHGLSSLGAAGLVLFLSLFAFAIALIAIFVLIGFDPAGVSANV